ncbi:M23 family metallopeptidase [Altericroceibacterium endophyticum]|uniref:Peptidoglycan DD-metalloendopeptidase family protein n=1 Tax=Altericroceibacterium endophyticum TaxID=1808508 RepID=A0A6I4T4R3_9SPHN|nr:M23 family metallopeptidase [Altericroceibacterium endophyticum]MXO64655.1 peptidoglycan DD-metalloendopeptidase family protein [Altericroceibacterium endophyticum]
MASAEKIQAIAVTATLTSALWIVVGSFVVDDSEELKQPAPEPAVSASTAPPPRETTPISSPDDRQTATLMIPVLDVSAKDLVDNFSDISEASDNLHAAIDIMAPSGTSVVAAAPGTIERIYRSIPGGNTIYVRSDDGETIHYYAQMGKYAPGLREGQKIRRGQRLGSVGSSGNADPETPHLHFAILRTTADAEWWEPSSPVNPYPLLTR